MTIETLQHQYYILQKISETKEMEHFLCREESSQKSSQVYDIFKIKDRRLAVKLILIFTEQMNHAAFSDFCECFSKNGELYLVFLHKKTIPLEEKLEKEDCSRQERILIGKKILEQLLLLDMPQFLAYDILNLKQIQVSEAYDVSFLYELNEIQNFEMIGMREIQNELANVMERIFQYELFLRISEEITEFLNRLKNNEYEDILQIYQAYLHLAETLEDSKSLLKPNTFWFRVWDKVKAFWKKVKAYLLGFIVLGAAVYLIYAILNPKPNTEESFDFQRIGTLMIEENEIE